MFCMNCGAQLPSNAKFCLNCGAEIKIPDPNDSHPADKGQTEPVPDKEEATKQHKDDSVSAAVTKYNKQMKLAYLPWAVGGVITFFYALFVPDYTKYELYAALTIMQGDLYSMMKKDMFSIAGIWTLGIVLQIICSIIIIKQFNTALGLPGMSKNLLPEDRKDLKHFKNLCMLIGNVSFGVGGLIYVFRVSQITL